MYTHETKVRVRYSETDQMGYCYYGNYASYFEVGRVEALRNLGVSYKELEDEGVLMPVIDFSIKYLRPAYYDEELIIKTTIAEIKGVRIKFLYETFNFKNEKINFGETILVFVDKNTKRPIQVPRIILDTLDKRII